ncbi:ty3-gypsy retrotransposon protein [Cucumis melo var. makuwa]|uniref:Ty3-gypsy retrotransposon protein n=1 Tax=Cucumis melo var. makuwa TaxID=1194695 RepID=A0A5A7V9F5_CUCMM|nr:ty3-gypsy retrotransposon protein [Cucumis melo var. makuwa]
MIVNSIRAQYGGPLQTSFMYSKPYTKRIDNLRMPLGQFVRSLKGNVFKWYTDLEPEVIDSWEQLEIEFLNRFCSTRRVVSMMELTNTKWWKGEPVIDYIQPIESSKPGLQRQAHRTVCSRDVHPRYALGTSL